MKPRIFISRSVNDKSDFVEAIKFHFPQADIFGEQLIVLHPIPFILPNSFDGCFFYSQNGVSYFLDHLDQPALMLKNKFIGVIGNATASFLEKQGFIPQFIGTGNMENDAIEIIKTQADKTILFPQAHHSKNSLEPFLSDQLKYIPLKVYQNELKEIQGLPDFDVLAFTSPMNVESYICHRSFQNELLVAIGNTTAEALQKHSNRPITIAEYPSEKQLVLAVIKALKK